MVTMAKLSNVHDLLSRGYNVILSDADVVLFDGAVPALLHSIHNTDLAIQQNHCGPKKVSSQDPTDT